MCQRKAAWHAAEAVVGKYMAGHVLAVDLLPGSSLAERLFQKPQEVPFQVICMRCMRIASFGCNLLHLLTLACTYLVLLARKQYEIGISESSVLLSPVVKHDSCLIALQQFKVF